MEEKKTRYIVVLAFGIIYLALFCQLYSTNMQLDVEL